MGRHAESIINLLRTRRRSGYSLWAAEIGVWRGDVSRALLASCPDLTLVMVDAWREFPPEHPYRESTDSMARLNQAAYDEARNMAVKATDEYADRRIIIHGSSEAVSSLVMPRFLDLVFVDAEHSLAAVSADINFWWDKVRPGGLLTGHDFATYEEVGKAVQEWLEGKRGLVLEQYRGDVWAVEKPGDWK